MNDEEAFELGLRAVKLPAWSGLVPTCCIERHTDDLYIPKEHARTNRQNTNRVPDLRDFATRWAFIGMVLEWSDYPNTDPHKVDAGAASTDLFVEYESGSSYENSAEGVVYWAEEITRQPVEEFAPPEVKRAVLAWQLAQVEAE